MDMHLLASLYFYILGLEVENISGELRNRRDWGSDVCWQTYILTEQESKAVKRLGLMAEALHGLLEVSGTMSYMSL